MSTALRELIAVFGIQFDDKGVRKANVALDGLGAKSRKVAQGVGGQRGAAGGLQQAGTAAGVAAGQVNTLGAALKGLGAGLALREVFGVFSGAVGAASDVQETANLIDVTFGSAAKGVKDFAAQTGAALGRNQFQLRDYAAQIGAIVGPGFTALGDKADATTADVATSFASLAVDLASAFNTTEDEALEALRSGIVGQSEPLLKYGVTALVSNVAEFSGIKTGDFNKLSESEKILARYRYIMARTQKSQGDASRTADEFANASRGVGAGIDNLQVMLGEKLLPYIKSATVWVRDALFAFQEWASTSHILEGALAGLGLVAAALGWALLSAFAPVLVPLLGLVAAAGALALIVDEVLTTMDGGDTIINDFLEALTGIKGAGKVWTDAMAGIGSAIYDLFHGGGAALDAFVQDWIKGANYIASRIIGAFKNAMTYIKSALKKVPVLGLAIRAADAANAIGPVNNVGRGIASGAVNALIPGAGNIASAAGLVQSPQGSMIGDAYNSVADAIGAYFNSGVTGGSAGATINVDARGATSPAEIERAAERGAKKALREQQRHTARTAGG